MRIIELAKEFNMQPLELVDYLRSKGIAVRNHMSVLSDEDVEKVKALKSTETEEKLNSSSVKKKVIKKKVIKNKVAKKDEAKTLTKVTKRRSIIRKKKVDKKVEVKQVKDVSKDSDLKAEEKPSIQNKEQNLKEAVERVDNYEYGNKKEKQTEDTDYDQDEKKSKKRLKNLANVVGHSLSRSKILQQTRADNELKSYAVLSGIGKPIYTTIHKKRDYSGPAKETEITKAKESKRIIKIEGSIDIVTLSRQLGVKKNVLINDCLDLNLLVKDSDILGMQLAGEIAQMYDHKVENISFDESKFIIKEESEDKKHCIERPPVITVMGHVDHGKTTLLDYIRGTKVVASEDGGITQHIGAYSVDVNGSKLTFLDTPGHAAFSSIRKRGANITDIVVLVVAADDGVMPQTKESIKFIKEANVPMIIAINKMDKEGVSSDKIKQELMEFNITPEEWGGDVMMVEISALKGKGVDNLLESIALQAEIMDLKANPKSNALGVILESKIEQGRGCMATVLVSEGILKKGDVIVAGESYGRVKSAFDYLSRQLKEVPPSTPAQILGLDRPPQPGESFNIVKNEREARKIVENRTSERKKLNDVSVEKTLTLDNFFSEAEGDTVKKLSLIIRSDTIGSYEAIKSSLIALSNNEVSVDIINGGVGAITDNDIQFAISSKAIVIGFNMRPVTSAARLAEDRGVEVKTYSIIYELINDVTLALEGILDPDLEEKYIGRAEVRETFNISKVGTIAGSYVIDGSLNNNCNIRLLRNEKIIYDGKLSSLKRFKDNVKEVKNNMECGVSLENFNDIKVGDVFEAYIINKKKRKLDDIVMTNSTAKVSEDNKSL